MHQRTNEWTTADIHLNHPIPALNFSVHTCAEFPRHTFLAVGESSTTRQRRMRPAVSVVEAEDDWAEKPKAAEPNSFASLPEKLWWEGLCLLCPLSPPNPFACREIVE